MKNATQTVMVNEAQTINKDLAVEDPIGHVRANDMGRVKLPSMGSHLSCLHHIANITCTSGSLCLACSIYVLSGCVMIGHSTEE